MDTNDNAAAIVEFIKVTKIYPPDVIALRDISFTVREGEMLFLTGMSGAGKSTMLKLISSLERPTKGLIEVMGLDPGKLKASELQKLRQKTGVAYQDFKLLPKHTVFQNISMPLEVTYASPKKIRHRIDELLEALDLTNKKHILTGKLSRGEQQRVAIARAAANKPTLLLADEPTGNLDPTTTELVVNLFDHLSKNGTTMIIATHDKSIYQDSGKRLIDLSQGRLKSNGY